MPAPTLAPCPAGVDPTVWSAACEAVREVCGWHVAPSHTETVKVDGSGGAILLLPTLHLTDLTAVSNDGTAVADPEWSESGMVRSSGWTSKFRGVEVTMTHGYPTCPASILGVLRAAVTRGAAGSMVSQVGQVRYSAAASQGAAEYVRAQAVGALAAYTLGPRP